MYLWGKVSIFILIKSSGFAYIPRQIIVQDQNGTCSSQWPIFCPSPPKLLCSKAKSKQCSKKGCKFLAISLPLHMLPRSPRGEAELSIWPFFFFFFFLPFSPPSTYVHTDMVYSLCLNSIITLDFYQTWGQGSRKGDWPWVWVWQGPVALSGRRESESTWCASGCEVQRGEPRCQGVTRSSLWISAPCL